MFANSLTTDIGLKVGPAMFDVLVRHYFDHLKLDVEKSNCLKQDDVLYHEAFTIVKAFLNISTFHTVEELQSFSNTRTPSPPWTHVVRTLVPRLKCEEAASYLIKALGGEEVAKRLIGGVKWWQVRGVNGVDAQWITAKKDWKASKRKHKLHQRKGFTGPSPGEPEPGDTNNEAIYDKDMDATRCILYLHGGGYYFGSVDQERYSIQRHARKINGRVFAINYRLAPQYPFPCGLQDALAAYLFLIRPPPDSDHQAVNPAHIVISGNSAGGGLSLALLQVIRDSGLPPPAGGILVSPWCDLSHSFPSIHLNTKTDVIPDSGLSFHKPSLLWPPPSAEISSRVHASLRFRIRQAFKINDSHYFNPVPGLSERDAGTSTSGVNHSTKSSSDQSGDPQKVVITTESGETIEVNEQLHFYAQNSLLSHPLISPVNSYLGGLPPLLFIAGDKEVLRDEIIYCAHKAAHPDRFPIADSARTLYPSLISIEGRYKATSVHLQVYDEAPHILPVLFSFTTPAKFCFRAIASFSRFVTEMATPSIPRVDPISRRPSLFAGFKVPFPERASTLQSPEETEIAILEGPQPPDETPRSRRKSLKRALSSQLSRVSSVLRGQPSPTRDSPPELPVFAGFSTSPCSETSLSSDDVARPLTVEPVGERTAGDPAVYNNITQHSSWDCDMIRERVSTKGVVRPLELEAELQAFQLQPQDVGRFSGHTINRYVKEREIFNKKFSNTFKSIEKHRRQNLERAKHDTLKRLGFLRQFLHKSDDEAETIKRKESVILSPRWGWAWALDEEEDPPPSSIVSRRDTEEAQKLAEVADKAVLGDDHTISDNNLWSFVINFLTATPGKDNHILHKGINRETDSNKTEAPLTLGTTGEEEKRKSKFPRILTHQLHIRKEQTSSLEEKNI